MCPKEVEIWLAKCISKKEDARFPEESKTRDVYSKIASLENNIIHHAHNIPIFLRETKYAKNTYECHII